MSDEYQSRLQKLQNIKTAGLDPYPALSQRTDSIAGLLLNFDQLRVTQEKATIAGRLKTWRSHGGSTFLNLADDSGQIQVYLKKDTINQNFQFSIFNFQKNPQDNNQKQNQTKSDLAIEQHNNNPYQFFIDNFDMADFVEFTGVLFITKRGEKTLLAENYRLLAKSLRPLPEKWHGLADVEIRFRKRYLDLIASEEVKKRFLARSRLIHLIRVFFTNKGYIEVETPVLQPIYGGGQARPFKTHHNALDIPLYLRISTELYLKRLNVGGFEKIFEIGKVFRNEGVDLQHNPEFTMLETMESYINYEHNMNLVEELYEYLARDLFGKTEIEYQDKTINFNRPWKRVTMVGSVKEITGIDYYQLSSIDQARARALKVLPAKKDELMKFSSIGEIIAFLFEEKVEQTLIQPTIIYQFPVETSPLAKKCSQDQRFVERFEHYICGKEAGNHYTELNDPLDLKQRFLEEKKKIEAGFNEAHQTDDDFLEAIEHGMPPTSGIGIGLDRLIMLFTNAKSIKEVIFFPTMRPVENLKSEISNVKTTS